MTATTDLEENKKIYLTLLNGTGYVFNVDDYMKIRTEHRIVGSFVGTCHSRGWSANTIALPVELTKFETQLLIEKNIAVVVKKGRSLLKVPDSLEIEKYNKLSQKRIDEQADIQKEQKIKESEKNIEKILAGKRNKMIKNGVAKKDINLTAEDVINDIRNSIKFDKNNALIEIPLQHSLEHDGEIFNLPSDHSIKYRIFRDMWEKSKFITSGEGFGADFIVYPGDPMMFHASHIVIILANPIIMPSILISKCRLSVAVNKICVFAYENSKKEISYQTVSWEGGQNKIQTSNDDENDE